MRAKVVSSQLSVIYCRSEQAGLECILFIGNALMGLPRQVSRLFAFKAS